jgi:hypothetical protein
MVHPLTWSNLVACYLFTNSATTQPNALRIHFIRIRIRRRLSRAQFLRRLIPIAVVARPVEMSHLVKNTTSLVVVIAAALRRQLGEVPEAVVGTRHDDVGGGYGVEQRAAIGAVAVGVFAGDRGGGCLYVLYVVVDGLDL